MFSKFDKVTKSDAFLYDLKFSIAVVNPNKTFDIFLDRFTSAIALLDFTDWHKISNFQQTLCEQLWFKITDGTTYILFSQYVSRCRQCNLDLCQADGFSTRDKGDKSNRFRLRSNTSESKTENPISCFEKEHYEYGNFISFFYRSGYLKERLIKEGQCFKCDKQDYHSTDPDAQYQSQSAVLDR